MKRNSGNDRCELIQQDTCYRWIMYCGLQSFGSQYYADRETALTAMRLGEVVFPQTL